MRVVFLDFDGVLNSAESFRHEKKLNNRNRNRNVRINETLCAKCTKNFQSILDAAPDLRIVISSTWRHLYSLDWLKDKLASYGIDSSRVIDKTPGDDMGDRGDEIQEWLVAHPEVTEYIVLDDNSLGLTNPHTSRFVHTTWDQGLTAKKSREAIYKLTP